jgi:hypothetical protein
MAHNQPFHPLFRGYFLADLDFKRVPEIRRLFLTFHGPLILNN